MEDIKTGGSLAKTNDGRDHYVFRRGYQGVNVGSRERSDRKAHVGTDVQRHIAKRLIDGVRYEVSEKHFETNLHIICAGVSVSTMFMVPPHLGQSQDDPVIGISFARVTVAISSRWRQSSSDKDRW